MGQKSYIFWMSGKWYLSVSYKALQGIPGSNNPDQILSEGILIEDKDQSLINRLYSAGKIEKCVEFKGFGLVIYVCQFSFLFRGKGSIEVAAIDRANSFLAAEDYANWDSDGFKVLGPTSTEPIRAENYINPNKEFKVFGNPNEGESLYPSRVMTSSKPLVTFDSVVNHKNRLYGHYWVLHPCTLEWIIANWGDHDNGLIDWSYHFGNEVCYCLDDFWRDIDPDQILRDKPVVKNGILEDLIKRVEALEADKANAAKISREAIERLKAMDDVKFTNQHQE